VFNFITSAVEQHVLDSWAQTEAGLELSPYLTEILGKRPGFVKGRDHFSHVAARLDGGVIYCVADAPAEISMATELSRDFNIVPIGFAYGVHKHDVMQAVALAEQLVTSPSAAWVVPPPCGLAGGQVDVSERLINLPDSIQVVASLEASGARFVVAGSAQSIMSELGSLLLG
jgi:hypothetical protein